MKLILALVLFALALSLCNLLGRRGANNSNSNERPSGTSTESSPAENSNTSTQPAPPRPGSGTSRNSNMTAPPTVSAGPPGVRTLPSANQNTAA